jgi:hypothetical protein
LFAGDKIQYVLGINNIKQENNFCAFLTLIKPLFQTRVIYLPAALERVFLLAYLAIGCVAKWG